MRRCTYACVCAMPMVAMAVGTNLAGTTTRSDVSTLADLALDVRDMRTNCDEGDVRSALNIYEAGSNSVMLDGSGQSLSYKRNLTGFSLNSNRTGAATYLTHMYGLASGGKLESFSPDSVENHHHYADTFVRRSFNDDKCSLGVEAAVSLNLWMFAAHVLWTGMYRCEQKGQPRYDSNNDDNDKEMPYDEFMAYWIGTDQPVGGGGNSSTETKNGYALYALTQEAASLFGKTSTESPEAPVNTQIKALYEDASIALSFPGACTSQSTTTVEKLWDINGQMISRMIIPLIQMLIHSMQTQDLDKIRLYALAVVPQMSACRRSVYLRLHEQLLDRTYDSSRFLAILGDLQSMYDCLGLSCEDIGAYRVSVVGQCAGYPINYPLAEYSPTTNVRQQSRIDLDVFQMKLFLAFDTDTAWAVAQKIYMFGKNSISYQLDDYGGGYDTRSLQIMATSSVRKLATPLYQEFTEVNNDPNYAHTKIMETFEGKGRWKSRLQRRHYITTVLQYQVVWMFLLSEMGDAVQDCVDKNYLDNENYVHSWDEVAAYTIGSLEGIGRGGSDDFMDGQFIWNLANQRGIDSGTENSAKYATINEHMEDLLYAGKGQLDAYDCENLKQTVTRLQHATLIPMLQSVVKYAVINSGTVGNSTDGADLAIGEAFADAVLPAVHYYDPTSANILRRNMIVSSDEVAVPDGAQAVADAILRIVNDLGTDCEALGKYLLADVCLNANHQTQDANDGAKHICISSVVWSFVLTAGLTAIMA